MKTVRDICKFIASMVPSFPICVETGCSYVCSPGDEIHTTTNNIVEYICVPKLGRLVSIDSDPEHVEFSQKFLGENNRMSLVHFECGDSVSVLHNLCKELDEIQESCPGPDGRPMLIDVLCLDSKEWDEDHMVNEYNAISKWLKPDKHFVLVDDIHNPNSVKYKKMVPLLKRLDYNYIEVPTPTGMFVASKGYPLL